MNKNIIDFINSANLNNISDTLQQISKSGIPIKDTFAPITTSVNVLTTIFATAFGGWITIQLFKRQEKMRIKQELRLNFFKDYREMYKELVRHTVGLHIQIELIKEINKDSVYIKEPYKDPVSNRLCWNISRQEDVYEESIKISKSIFEEFDKLERHMGINKIISGYKDDPYNIVYASLSKVVVELSNIEISQQMLNEEDKDGVFETFNIELMEKHNESVDEILKFDELLKSSIENMDKIHEKIENEFIGNYFK